MNYGYQGSPVDNFGRPTAPDSFGTHYPSNDPSYLASNPTHPPYNQSYPQSHNIGFQKDPISSNMSYPKTPHSNHSMPPFYPIPSQQGPYPPQHGSYPPQHGSYPPQHGSYPPQHGSYPPQHESYPPQHGSCPSQQACFPPKQTHHASPQQCPVASQHGGKPSGGPWSGPKVSVKHSPTIHPYAGFDPRRDAEALRKAMKGIGTDEKTLIEILARRVNSQRLEIALQFKTLFGRDLIKDIKSETTGNFEDLLVALLTPLPQYYAAELHNATARIGTKENVLFEILCTASNNEIRLINDAYRAMYNTRLEDDISGDTSFNLKRLLIALSLGNRDESSHVDPAAAQEDAKQLLRAGELRAGTDESVFHQIFVIRNRSQLQLIFNKYRELTGNSIEKAIEEEFSGDLKDAFLAIAKSTQDRVRFFAEELYKSMKGCGTDDNSLIRLIVTHCESDLGEIKNKFQSIYSKSLRDWVDSETSGDYRKCLMALIG